MSHKKEDIDGPLTPQEKRTLMFLAEGYSNDEIAGKMLITPHTSKFHVNSIFLKLGVKNRVSAVVKALKRGILKLDELMPHVLPDPTPPPPGEQMLKAPPSTMNPHGRFAGSGCLRSFPKSGGPHFFPYRDVRNDLYFSCACGMRADDVKSEPLNNYLQIGDKETK